MNSERDARSCDRLAAVGWAFHPLMALLIVLALPVFYAISSRGLAGIH